MENEKKQNIQARAKRYTEAEKAEILEFISNYPGIRGAQKAAIQKYGVSAVTISNWLKTVTKTKKNRKRGGSSKLASRSLIVSDPDDLRRLASLMEEIAELESLVNKLDDLREEAEVLQAKLLGQ